MSEMISFDGFASFCRRLRVETGVATVVVKEVEVSMTSDLSVCLEVCRLS